MASEQIENKKIYSAEELVWATQLVYCDFTELDIKKYDSVADIFSARNTETSEMYEMYYNYAPDAHPSGDQKIMLDETKTFMKAVAEGEKCKGWKIVDVENMENENGLYAVTIETGENEAIIAFRGSESFTHNGSSDDQAVSLDLEQIARDWVIADGGIAHGDFTDQELAAGQYLDYIAERFDYEKLAGY